MLVAAQAGERIRAVPEPILGPVDPREWTVDAISEERTAVAAPLQRWVRHRSTAANAVGSITHRARPNPLP